MVIIGLWFEGNDEYINYTNKGYGYARGVDAFIKSDYGFVSGWFCYSFLQSKRKEKLYNGLVPTDYDITHQFKIASKVNVTSLWNINLTYRYMTGKPYHSGYGLWNKKRDPDYGRIDLSFSYLRSFFDGNLTIFYWAIGNILGNRNVIHHNYSPDYSETYIQKSFQKRTIYFGVNFGF